MPQKQLDYKKRYRTLASTYLTFGPDGSELLVNLGGEQIYLFDVSKKLHPRRFDLSILGSNGIVKGLCFSFSYKVLNICHKYRSVSKILIFIHVLYSMFQNRNNFVDDQSSSHVI